MINVCDTLKMVLSLYEKFINIQKKLVFNDNDAHNLIDDEWIQQHSLKSVRPPLWMCNLQNIESYELFDI